MHPSPQEANSPAIGHLKEREGHTHGGSNPKLGRRIKAAASSFASKLHIPGTGHPSAHPTGGGPVPPAVEHHRITAEHVAPETPTQRPQWQVEEPHDQFQEQKPQEREIQPQQRQRHDEMQHSPATPSRETGKKESTPQPHSAREAPVSPSQQKEELPAELKPEVRASTSTAEAPPGTNVSNLPLSSVPETEDPHQGVGNPTIPTPFSGIQSPARGSSDTDELKPTYIKPLPSLDRSTESQEVYVGEMESLVDEKGRAVGVGRSSEKTAAQRLSQDRRPALQELKEEDRHTDAGPSPMHSAYAKTSQQEAGEEVEPGEAQAGGQTATNEPAERSSEAAGASAEGRKDSDQENLEREKYATIQAEKKLEKEEATEDQVIAAARRRAEIEEAEGRRHPKAMTHPLESPSGNIVIPALEIPVSVVL